MFYTTPTHPSAHPAGNNLLQNNKLGLRFLDEILFSEIMRSAWLKFILNADFMSND